MSCPVGLRLLVIKDGWSAPSGGIPRLGITFWAVPGGVLVKPGVESTTGLDYFSADSGAMPFGLSLRKMKVTDPSKKLG
jgi:hypothetical protein